MFQVGQKVTRTVSSHLSNINGMVVGQIYTISWVSDAGISCKVVELPDTTWQTSKFAVAEGYELPAEPKTTFEPVVVKTIFYNRRSLPSAPAKV